MIWNFLEFDSKEFIWNHFETTSISCFKFPQTSKILWPQLNKVLPLVKLQISDSPT